MFERKGLFLVPADKIDEDTLMEIALEAGADDVKRVDDKFEITCDPSVFAEVGAALAAKGIEPEVSEITRIPNSTIDLDAETGRKVLKLMEKLDDHDDVQNVSANFNIPDEAMAEWPTAAASNVLADRVLADKRFAKRAVNCTNRNFFAQCNCLWRQNLTSILRTLRPFFRVCDKKLASADAQVGSLVGLRASAQRNTHPRKGLPPRRRPIVQSALALSLGRESRHKPPL